mmetsp:Transcript_88069/g.247581  ORF Transcript_88069/g.247581 Transcript_88069/m.247581 type:complete len:264 (+) Transcript_88069:1018-1809(+)
MTRVSVMAPSMQARILARVARNSWMRPRTSAKRLAGATFSASAKITVALASRSNAFKCCRKGRSSKRSFTRSFNAAFVDNGTALPLRKLSNSLIKASHSPTHDIASAKAGGCKMEDPSVLEQFPVALGEIPISELPVALAAGNGPCATWEATLHSGCCRASTSPASSRVSGLKCPAAPPHSRPTLSRHVAQTVSWCVRRAQFAAAKAVARRNAGRTTMVEPHHLPWRVSFALSSTSAQSPPPGEPSTHCEECAKGHLAELIAA